ncbi:VirB3 family type IV secretion system protein [Hydrogenophaga sp.]|uniref:VirB3 family type IV secretion system protein n=1 Tax=Hydrogenophaga sp. TaxID=1904254 RepID=UPI0026350CB2|nr:VirB3 family type IV secretion system protein [Hydrogenophaga sp.]MCW5654236.1 VirB3 family type IV secretion system protein [Hydrogenophaga sp.]
MSDNQMQCESDAVFLALARPPMMFGVTDIYAVMMMIMVMLIFLGIGGGKGMVYAALSAPALYVFGYAMCERDPRVFQLWGVKLANFSAGQRRSAYWGGVSFDPGGCARPDARSSGRR